MEKAKRTGAYKDIKFAKKLKLKKKKKKQWIFISHTLISINVKYEKPELASFINGTCFIVKLDNVPILLTEKQEPVFIS